MKRTLTFGLMAAALLTTVVAFMTASPTISTDAVFLASEVVTMSDDTAPADAVYVRDGSIAALGSHDEMRALADGDIDIVDLRPAVLLPGFVEAHTHPTAAALLGTMVDVSGFTHDDRTQVMATLRDAASRWSPFPWLLAFGWDPVMVADLDPPTREELDAIEPHRPMVILTQMMHDAYANSAALAAAGIDETTENPAGAEFVRDGSGRLTGTVREVAAIEHLLDAVPAPPEGSAELLLGLQYAKYARAGYTALGVLGPAGNTERPIHMMAELAEDEHVPVRAVVYGLPGQLDEGGWRPGRVNARLDIRGVKYWMDGSPFAGGAAWAKPYENTPLTLDRLHLSRDHMPDLNHEEARFEREFERFHRAGFQVAVHAQGERAIERVLDVVERVSAHAPRSDARHRLEHNALITRAQLERALRLGVAPSFFIDHIRFYGNRLPEIVGLERTERYMPVGTALEIGHRATLHSDNPATPIGPMRVLQTAVRRVPDGSAAVIGADERLSIEQALRAITIDAAWQLGMEKRIGSIEVGKAADFTVLSRNPLVASVEKLTEIEVVGTWIDGQPVDTRPWRRANVARAWTALVNAARR